MPDVEATIDVYESAQSAFFDEIRRENVRLTEPEIARIRAAYNFASLQKYIDTDIQTVRLRAPYYEKDRVARERESYHQQNIQDIARTIARRVALEKRQRPFEVITESKSDEFRRFAKTAGAKGCDVYPCENR